MKIAVAVVVVVVAVVAAAWWFSSAANDGPRFLSARETTAMLRRDADGFLAGLPRSRRSGWIAEGRRFTAREKTYLRRAIAEADERLSPWPALARLPWTLAKVPPAHGEFGWPHTRRLPGSAIAVVLPKPLKTTVEDLIHEKVHVFQKTRPRATRRFLERRGYVRARRSSSSSRRNPDADDGWVWIHPRSGMEMTPKTARGWPALEHPLEELAYATELVA
jgi:hypothetical protein